MSQKHKALKSREGLVDQYIPEAAAIASSVWKNKKGTSWTRIFMAAMNKLTSRAGLRVLTGTDKAEIKIFFG